MAPVPTRALPEATCRTVPSPPTTELRQQQQQHQHQPNDECDPPFFVATTTTTYNNDDDDGEATSRRQKEKKTTEKKTSTSISVRHDYSTYPLAAPPVGMSAKLSDFRPRPMAARLPASSFWLRSHVAPLVPAMNACDCEKRS